MDPLQKKRKTDSAEKRTWERHKWEKEHDVLLFKEVIANNAWSKKFGCILKRWADVGDKLSRNSLFRDWGKLKVDMLRRRFDKLFGDTSSDLKANGLDLPTADQSSLNELQTLVLDIRRRREDCGEEVKEMKKSKKTMQIEEDTEQIIRETVVSFLNNHQSQADVDEVNELISGFKTLSSVGGEVPNKLVKDILDKQHNIIGYLSKQNSTLLDLVATLLQRNLT